MKYIILCLILSVSFTVSGQLNTDSLLRAYERQPDDTSKVNTLAALYNSTLYNDPEASLGYARQELQLSRQLDYTFGVGQSLYHLGSWYYNYDQYDSTEYYYGEALLVFKEMENIERLTEVLHGYALLHYARGKYDSALSLLDQNIRYYRDELQDSVALAISHDLKGVIHTFLGNFQIALRETLKAVEILKNSEAEIRYADALGHMAIIEFYLENFHESIAYNQQALAIYESHDDKYYITQVYNDLGNTYYYLKEYGKAIDLLEQSLEMSENMGIEVLRLTTLTNLGRTYHEMDLTGEGLTTLQEALRLAENQENINKKVEARMALARLYLDTGQPEASLPYLDQAIAEADSIGVKPNSISTYLYRSEAYEKLGRTREALRDYQQYATLRDSVLNEKKSRQIEEMRTLYETEKKEQQIALQENEIMLLQQEARLDTMQKLLLGGGLLLALIGVYGIRQKLQRNKLEKQQVEKELEFRKKELTTHALHLARKNAVLEELRTEAEQLRENEPADRGLQKLIRTISSDLRSDANWEQFSRYFEQVHANFNQRVKEKYPDLTANELRLLALMKMNLSSKEIASILNVSADGIKKARYRVRKKMDIPSDDTLQDFVISL